MPRSRDASSTARRNDPSCCVSAARKRFPKAMPFSSSLLSVAKRCEKSFTSAGSPSARTVSALRMSPGAGTSRAIRTFPVERPESVTAMSPVMSSVCRRSPAITVGAPRPPPTHTARSVFTPRMVAEIRLAAVPRGLRFLDVAAGGGPLPRRRWALRSDGLLPAARPAFRRRRAQPAGRFGDLVIRADLDPMSLRRGRDLSPRRLFRAFGLELGLVPARHRVPDVGLVVQRQVALTVLVDVGEGALVELFAVFGV